VGPSGAPGSNGTPGQSGSETAEFEEMLHQSAASSAIAVTLGMMNGEPGKTTSASIAIGSFNNTEAFGVGLTHYFNNSDSLSIRGDAKAALTMDGSRETGYGVALTFGW
jgi:hypothetical protein